MTELERRALLGDKEAQKECTEKGIVLPCPICGKSVVFLGTEAEVEMLDEDDDNYCELSIQQTAVCNWNGGGCGLSIGGVYGSKKEALAVWNTRQAPPIGQCGECKNGIKIKKSNDSLMCHKPLFGSPLAESCESDKILITIVKETDWCSHFEPRCEE